MPPTSAKNMMASVTDLGLGDQLATQMQGETEEQRKKRLAQKQSQSVLGPAAQSLFGNTTLGAPGG